MDVVQFDGKTLKGISTRTTNQDEMNPDTARIGKLWRNFDEAVEVDYRHGERVYGVYYDYESDANGKFSVMAAFDGAPEHASTPLQKITLPAGKYLRFDAAVEADSDAARKQAVIDCWGEIWRYFSNQPEYQRAYDIDFEFYKNQTKIEIYISIL